MSLFSFKNNRFKILNITVIRLKVKSKGIVLYFLGIPCYRFRGELSRFMAAFKLNKDFNTRHFDQQIKAMLEPYVALENQKDNNKIGFLATEIYDMGGHTKCIRDLIMSLSNNYQQFLFLTRYSPSVKHAPNAINVIKEYANIRGIDANFLFFQKNVKKYCAEIIATHLKTLLVYIHPDDVFGAAILAYLKNTTDIKIIYFNHASHFPVLGMSFADVILEGTVSTARITKEMRGFSNTQAIGLQSLARNETVYYSREVLDKIKKELGVPTNYLVTMSGASSYKFFDGKDSQYFRMIKNLLTKEANLVHVIITKLSRKEKEIVENIFQDNTQLMERLKIIPYQTNFDKYFQCADVFIDSFPISSALTQIDLMRNKVVSVVKINKEKPKFSFHEYQMPDYPYMFEDIMDMEKAIIELLHNKVKRQKIIAINYDYWLKTYESSVVRDKYIKIIEEI